VPRQLGRIADAHTERRSAVAIEVGSSVHDPRPEAPSERKGLVVEVRRNPACQLRSLVVLWSDGEEEELLETEFGPLED
jgi:hypothetical protein